MTLHTSSSLSGSCNEYALGFTSLDKETRLSDLPVQGELPAWLRGTLLRTGPARYETDQQPLRHWFDGYAMLHAFSFADGKVSYANQFLDSRAYQHAHDKGTVGYREFATDPCRSIFKRFTQLFTNQQNLTDNGNVNVAKLAGEFVALTEIPLPVAFDKTTLKTTGTLVYDDALKRQSQGTTAHPHFDPTRGETINLLVRFGRRSIYTMYLMPFGQKRRVPIATISARRPAYIHSFGLTPNYIILVESPLRVNPFDLLLRDRPFIENYRWQTEEPSHFILAHRDSKVDINTRDALVWQEAGCYPGEPVFVPAPASASGEEDDGLILSVVLDVRRKHSFLLVLDARSFTELARSAVPHHIPFGFHGSFFQCPSLPGAQFVHQP